MTVAKLIVGLGNPGEEMEETRHNIGFKCADFISHKLSIPFKIDKKKSIYGKKSVNQNTEVIILKPQTFINLSGEAVLYIASFLKVDIENIFIMFDDINRRVGTVEIEDDISKISHNAIKMLCQSLRQDNFIKCAVGVGPMPKDIDDEKFYLGEFSNNEKKHFPSIFEKSYKLALKSLNVDLPE